MTNIVEAEVRKGDIMESKFEIGIIGMGYVGSTLYKAFTTLNPGQFQIKCMDKDSNKAKINKLTEEFVNVDILFICVGTPEGKTHEVERTLDWIGFLTWAILQQKRKLKYVIIKSTVPIGFCRKQQNRSGAFKILYNPEFLREGSAYSDFVLPSRIVIGKENENDSIEDSVSLFFRTYTLNAPCIIETTYENAELNKLANNAFLVMKLNFINSLAEYADSNKYINIKEVSKFLQYDKRIGDGHLNPGPGIGGPCLLKDTKMLIRSMYEKNPRSSFFDSLTFINDSHLNYITKCIDELCLGNKITIFGLSFKAGISDIRNSPSVYIIEKLIELDYIIIVNDPQARLNNSKVFQYDDPYIACGGADIVVILTEHEMYEGLDFEKIAVEMKGNIIYDTRNILNKEKVEKNTGLELVELGNV